MTAAQTPNDSAAETLPTRTNEATATSAAAASGRNRLRRRLSAEALRQDSNGPAAISSSSNRKSGPVTRL